MQLNFRIQVPGPRQGDRKEPHTLCDIMQGIHEAEKRKQLNHNESRSPTEPSHPMNKKRETQMLSQLQ